MADIANPDLFVCGSRTWISLDISRFYEERCQPSSGSAWPVCPKTVIGPPLLGAGGVDTICTWFARPLCRLEPHEVNHILHQGTKAYTTSRNHTFIQPQVKTSVPQGGVLSPTLFNIYTADIPPGAPVNGMAYADDITITSNNNNNNIYLKSIIQCT